MIHCLVNQNSPVSNWMSQLRDANLQKDPAKFRNNVRRISNILAYEIGKTLEYKTIQTATPLGVADCNVLNDKIVVASILRAGLSMHEGFLDVYENAENAFLSEYRSYNENGGFDIKFEYMASPNIDGKVLILVDPMLATGASVITAMEGLKKNGNPKKVVFASIISSCQGIEVLQNKFGKDSEIWTAATDAHLNSHGYIVPGLGDAGDLCYGIKL